MEQSSWYGSKKKMRVRAAARQKQSLQFNPNSRNNTIKFINKPLSNIDLLHRVKQLGIKYFRSIYSRDNLPEKIHRLEKGIINLDDSIGRGSHWVCYNYRNIDEQFSEYFDSFGLIMPNEIKNYLKTSGKKLFIRQMKCKKDIVFCALIGAYIIFWRDKKVDHNINSSTCAECGIKNFKFVKKGN